MNLTEEQILAAVRECFCAQLALTLGGAPRQCCIVTSEPVVSDCCNGVAWVRPVTYYPSTAFPAPDGDAKRCPTGAYALVLELGILRCLPGSCDPLKLCCEAEETATMRMLSDAKAMRKIFYCCLGWKGDDYVIGAWTPIEPEGACVGGKMAVTVRVNESCGC